MSNRETLAKPPVLVAPLLPVALAFIGGIVADRFLVRLGTLEWATIVLSAGGLALLTFQHRWIGHVLILVAIGASAGGWHHHGWSDLADEDLARSVDEAPRPVWVRGMIRDALGFRAGRLAGDEGVTRAILDLSEVYTGDGWREAAGRVMVTVIGDRSDLKGGEAVEAAGTLASVARALNPGEFDYKSYLRAQGIRLRLTVDSAAGVWIDPSPKHGRFDVVRLARWGLGSLRQWSQTRLEQGLDPSVAPLAAALVLGRREGVDPDVNDAFARTGTTHLLAISGLHMQVLALALGTLLVVAGVRKPSAYKIIFATTLAYALLVGLMPSVVRSAAMTATYCAAGLWDRKGRHANTLAAAALITLALNPADLFDVGCQLSFLAVAAIVWVAVPAGAWVVGGRALDPLDALERKFEPGWKGRIRRGRNGLVQGVVVSAVVWLAALPLVALRFHIISPIGILLNVPLVPLTSLALLASGVSLALGLVWGPLGWPFAWLGAICLRGTEWLVRWGVAQEWGHSFVPEPSWGWVFGFYAVLAIAVIGSVGFWRYGPGRKGWVGMTAAWAAVGCGLAVAPAVSTRQDEPPKAEVLAVGHGLAVVIETGGGHAVLYDCGRMRDPSVGRRIVAPALWARGISRLDAVVLSHADADHYNGLPDLLDRLKIAAVLVPPGFAGAANPGAVDLLAKVKARGVAVRTIAAGDAWSAGATRFRVLHPGRNMPTTEPDNARSIVLDVSWQGRHALLTGDLEGAGLGALTASRPAVEPIDVILSPHHGGKTANPASLYDWANPALVVVSQRALPPGARDPLMTLKVPVLRTWQIGAVRLTWTPSGIKARGFLDDENSSADDADGHR